MPEYEINFRDYLRVAWQRKWIIGGVFVAVFGMTFIITFLQPNQYQARALLSIGAVPPFEGFTPRIPSLPLVAEMLRSDELLIPITEKLRTDPLNLKQENFQTIESWLKQRLKANVLERAELIELEISGSRPLQQLRNTLTELTALVKSRLEQDFKADIGFQLDQLDNSIEILDAQLKELKDELHAEIAERKRILKNQQAELTQRLKAISTDSRFSRLPVGEQNATLQGIVLRQEFEALNNRVQEVERELHLLDSQGPHLFPDQNRLISTLQENRVQLVTRITKNRKIADQDWKALKMISTPYASEQPIGPKRLPNLLLAGVLGLFLGIVLAFFKHYLEQSSPAVNKTA